MTATPRPRRGYHLKAAVFASRVCGSEAILPIKHNPSLKGLHGQGSAGAGRNSCRSSSKRAGSTCTSTCSSSDDEGASKELKTTGTYPLNTTDFIPSNKVDVDKALLEKVKSEEVKAEMKRAKEARAREREAKKNEAREGVRKQIEEANLLAKESKEERKRAKVEANGVKEEAKKRAKDTKKRLKEEVSRAKKEKARLEIPKSKGVTWNKRSSKWEVIFCFDGKRRHLGYFDDRVGAVEVHSSYNSQ
jgi:hypothetical protein